MATRWVTPQELSADLVKVQIDRLPVTNFIPPEGEEFRFASYVAIPAIGAGAVVVAFTVPKGKNGILNRFANVFIGGGFNEGQGLITWQLALDNTNAAQPIIVPNFDKILASLGSVSNPTTLNGIRIKENQIVALLVANAVGGVVPAGQLIGGLLGGYFYPVDLEPADLAF